MRPTYEPPERSGGGDGFVGGIAVKRLVLPEGIELSTSPLPRECSTTELRQLEAFLGWTQFHARKSCGREYKRVADCATRANTAISLAASQATCPARNCGEMAGIGLVRGTARQMRPKSTMTTNSTKTGKGGADGEKSRKTRRDERLAEQLRANLKRRKAGAKPCDSSSTALEMPKLPDEA
jgi:hypothetical protein